MRGWREGGDADERAGPVGELKGRWVASGGASVHFDVIDALVIWIHLVLTADAERMTGQREVLGMLVHLRT